jgi:hypothetical protein
MLINIVRFIKVFTTSCISVFYFFVPYTRCIFASNDFSYRQVISIPVNEFVF